MSAPVDGRQALPPVGLSEDLLQHQRVDVDHAILQEVQRKHAQFVVFAVIAREVTSLAEKDEVIGPVPVLDDVESLVDLATECRFV